MWNGDRRGRLLIDPMALFHHAFSCWKLTTYPAPVNFRSVLSGRRQEDSNQFVAIIAILRSDLTPHAINHWPQAGS